MHARQALVGVSPLRSGIPGRVNDDDDWVGTPPEGHYSRDRARLPLRTPEVGLGAIGAGLLIAIIVLVVVLVA